MKRQGPANAPHNVPSIVYVCPIELIDKSVFSPLHFAFLHGRVSVDV